MLSLKRILALLLIVPVASVAMLEVGFLIRKIKTYRIISQHRSDNKILGAELQNFAKSLTKCAGLSKPKLILVKNTISEEAYFEQSAREDASTIYRSILDVILGRIIILIQEDTPPEELKKAVAHEIAHHLLQPSHYHVILDKILDKFYKQTYSTELAATELGNKLRSQCFKNKA